MNSNLDATHSDNTVYCCDLEGHLHAIPRSKLTFRPAVYGILLENYQVLLQVHPQTQLLQPPGGLVAPENAAVQAMRQHFRAATGVTPVVGELLQVEEEFRLDSEERAWHLSVMYYALSRPSGGRAGLIDFDSPSRPEWVSIENLKRSQLQLGYDAIHAAHLRLQSS